jgi:C4-dicarboxylate-specific signal transduction histidine kinase
VAPIIDHFAAFDTLAEDACALLSVDDYRIVAANARFRAWAKTAEDGSIFDALPDLPADRFKRGIGKRGRFRCQLTLQNLDSPLDVTIECRALDGDSGGYLFLHGRDRSREKEMDLILSRATRLLEQRNQELERLNRELATAHERLIMTGKLTALGRMAASMISEMRYPIQLIMVNASLLDDHIRDPESTEMFQAIVGASAQVNKIVETLQGFATDDARAPMITRDLVEVVQSTVSLCQTQIEARGVSLTVVTPDAPAPVLCHPTEISQVLLNLVNNAAESVEYEDDDMRWIEVRVARDGDSVEMSVTDGGDALPATLAEKLMEPFFTTKSGAGQGAGLGLTIARKIIAGHSGTLVMDPTSETPRFVARLPVAPDPDHDDGS